MLAMDELSKHRVEHVAPGPEVFERVAENLCRDLSVSDSNFGRPEVVSGIAVFLNVVARMYANHLNNLSTSNGPEMLDIEPGTK
jgi:hypothetical protein